LITDPIFYLAAVPAVILFGIAKGGFGSGLGVLAVPLIAMVVSPVQAAAILLPILCIMDLVGLWAYRGKWVLPELRILLPASLAGIAIGTLMFEFMSPARLRLLLGVVAISFTVNHWLQARLSKSSEQKLFGRRATDHDVFVAAGHKPHTIRRHDRGVFCGRQLRQARPVLLSGSVRCQQFKDFAGSRATGTDWHRHGCLAAQSRNGPDLFPYCLHDAVCRWGQADS
jgi:hypothetical protein